MYLLIIPYSQTKTLIFNFSKVYIPTITKIDAYRKLTVRHHIVPTQHTTRTDVCIVPDIITPTHGVNYRTDEKSTPISSSFSISIAALVFSICRAGLKLSRIYIYI